MFGRARVWFVIAAVVAGVGGALYGRAVLGVAAVYGVVFLAVLIGVRGCVIWEGTDYRRRHGLE